MLKYNKLQNSISTIIKIPHKVINNNFLFYKKTLIYIYDLLTLKISFL